MMEIKNRWNHSVLWISFFDSIVEILEQMGPANKSLDNQTLVFRLGEKGGKRYVRKTF
ncbi:hypothetical protein [Rummeliibacillus pycnus]|uniref:hypothetical protein n=1 Tax=Rummeliibacillus pycnus TaxID=101070 RepID=UPI001472E91D|nr:hypothetical protein [Rummeliibacillus pycnus]